MEIEKVANVLYNTVGTPVEQIYVWEGINLGLLGTVLNLTIRSSVCA